KARSISCLSNMKQIGTALIMYTVDYDERMPAAFPNVPPVNGGTIDRIPYDLQLMPYIKNDRLFTCPSDSSPRGNSGVWDGKYDPVRGTKVPRSYGYVGQLNTDHPTPNSEPDQNTGLAAGNWGNAGGGAGINIAAIDAPADTIAIVESWSLNTGSSTSDSI